MFVDVSTDLWQSLSIERLEALGGEYTIFQNSFTRNPRPRNTTTPFLEARPLSTRFLDDHGDTTSSVR
jgi:hypothetical protein